MNTSKGEEQIIKLLQKSHINFEREKSFKDLKGGLFKYDFYLKVDDQVVLIEVDGIQHFEYNKFFHKNRRGFLKQQEHDRRKNSYALACGYSLYRIPYWELQNIVYANDIFNEDFLVKDRNHNDYLRNPYNN